MMAEDMNENILPCTEGFLTAEELVEVRKPADEPIRQLVGDKFTTRTESFIEEEAVKCSIENLKEALKQKRASRQCDLIQAEWNEEQNAALTTKLKGKYVHHMGRTIQGKIALSPEESMFLLENGAIEIINGEAPMSTEEGFAVILKGKLSIEKYRVYSHLSQLGFIVVPHQKSAITRYEGQVNLDKHPVKKRKGSPLESPEHNKKRLTFSGALCDDPIPNTILIDSDIQMKHTLPIEGEVYENKEELEICEIAAEVCIEDIVETNAQETTADASIGLENEEMSEWSLVKSPLGLSSVAESNSHNVDLLPNDMLDVTACQIKETEEADPREAFVTSVGEKMTNVDADNSSDENMCYQVIDEEENVVEMDQQIEVEEEIKGQCDIHNSVSCSEFPSTYEHVIVEQQLENESQPAAEVPSRNEMNVMDVDSQDTEISSDSSETSNDSSETSSDHENEHNSANAVSQDSSSTVVDDQVQVNNINGSNNGALNLTCRSAPLLDADSRGSVLSGNELEDDDITLIEVTKKETKPLAVIDLLSGEEESSSKSSSSDDEISILEECSVITGSIRLDRQLLSKSKQLNLIKKEESPVQTPKIQTPAQTVHFPDLYQKNIVCVACPPLHLLPNHVKPSKEAYILDFSGKDSRPQPSQGRVWDNYRTMQDYQRSRSMNQSSELQSWDNRGLPHGMARSYPNTYQDTANRQTSLLGNPSSETYGNNRFMNSWEPNPPPRFQPTYPMPPNAHMNSVVSIQQQNMSMVRNETYLPMGPAFPPDLMSRDPSLIMSEVQRTAFAVARSMLAQMFNGPNDGQPMPPFNPFENANGYGSGLPNNSNSYNTYGNPAVNSNGYPAANSNGYPAVNSNGYPAVNSNSYPAVNSNGYPDSMANNRRGFVGQQRRHTGRPFPCHFRHASNKESWETVKEAVGERIESNESDIEEVPITSTEVLWDPAVMHPLVQSGVRYDKSAVLNALQKTQMAELSKCDLNEKCFEETGYLEVSFDVYLPGCNYRKTSPTIPKHRVIVVKATDPIPRFSELAYIQRKWNDGASLQIAFVDHGDVSFMSFSSVTLPSLIPNGSKK